MRPEILGIGEGFEDPADRQSPFDEDLEGRRRMARTVRNVEMPRQLRIKLRLVVQWPRGDRLAHSDFAEAVQRRLP